MSEETYYCPICRHSHKYTSKIGVKHLPDLNEIGARADSAAVEPDSTTVEPENPLEQVLTTLFNNQRNLLEDIKTLNENFERMGGVITTLTQGEAQLRGQQPQGPGWDGLGDEWNKLPPKLQDAVTGFLSNIGRAAVRFAGAGGDDEGEDIDERITRLIVKRRRAKIEENLLAGAETVLNMIDDADMELYAKPKEAK